MREWFEHDIKLERRDDGEWIVRQWIGDHCQYEGEELIDAHWKGKTPTPEVKPGHFSTTNSPPPVFNFFDPVTDLSSWSLDNTFITHNHVFYFWEPATEFDVPYWSLRDTFISHDSPTQDKPSSINQSSIISPPDSNSEGSRIPEPFQLDLFTLWS